MGIIYAHLRLANQARPDLEEIDADALVETVEPLMAATVTAPLAVGGQKRPCAVTGAIHLCIPEHVALQLQLAQLSLREVKTADGKSHLAPYVGPVRIEMLGRACITGALVLGDCVLLGAIPIEDMDLIIEPSRQRVSVNPLSPNIPMSLAMGMWQ